MSFVLPSDIKSHEDAPIPTDPRVSLETIPARTLAVRTFSGNMDDSVAQKEEQDFRLDVGRTETWKVKENGAAMLARYNPPWTLPWLKTNKVLVEVVRCT